MQICSIVGARPQFVKLAVLCKALARRPECEGWVHRIIHTGQHYDPGLSSVFFEELQIPLPDYHLGVGSGTHGEQTGEMLKGLEAILPVEKPDWILLYGDTNSTLAGALAGAKKGLPMAHIRDSILSVLTLGKAETLLTPEGKQQLKKSLVEVLNRENPELGVRDIYFTEFLVQR
jgi:UDP-N-acetylglucosamine 2-epimerase